ncbi:MAG: cohesin domain-containing protein [Patescibacteria group bacterium]|nr:cohesin domain-containing protein [Patescibacteria group bacterium]
MKKTRILFLIFICCSFFLSLRVDAKTVFYFDGIQPDNKSLEFIVYVRVDSDKPLNAYDLIVQYPSELIKFKQFDKDNSIINIWKKIEVNNQNEIILQGGSIQPFVGENGQIIALIFEALKAGQENFVFKKAAAYLADGKGTMADEIEIKNIPLYISQIKIEGDNQENSGLVVKQGPVIVKEDKIQPEILLFRIADNPFNSKEKFLIFETKDNSGMVKDFARVKKWFQWSDWYEITNPFGFSKNIWAIQFLAVDNFGNSNQRTVYFYRVLFEKLILIIIAILVIGLLVKLFYNKRR